MIQYEQAAPIKANGSVPNCSPPILRQRVWFLIAARSRCAFKKMYRFTSEELSEPQDISACYFVAVSLAEPGG